MDICKEWQERFRHAIDGEETAEADEFWKHCEVCARCNVAVEKIFDRWDETFKKIGRIIRGEE